MGLWLSWPCPVRPCVSGEARISWRRRRRLQKQQQQQQGSWPKFYDHEQSGARARAGCRGGECAKGRPCSGRAAAAAPRTGMGALRAKGRRRQLASLQGQSARETPPARCARVSLSHSALTVPPPLRALKPARRHSSHSACTIADTGFQHCVSTLWGRITERNSLAYTLYQTHLACSGATPLVSAQRKQAAPRAQRALANCKHMLAYWAHSAWAMQVAACFLCALLVYERARARSRQLTHLFFPLWRPARANVERAC